MTATANDPGAASLSGVYTGRMIILAFAISAAIGALGGIAITPINVTSYLSGGIYALSGFVAAVLGGWGSSGGALVGGLALGVIQSLATGFVPVGYQEAIAFVILILVLYFRPRASRSSGNGGRTMTEFRSTLGLSRQPDLQGASRGHPARLAAPIQQFVRDGNHDQRRALRDHHRIRSDDPGAGRSTLVWSFSLLRHRRLCGWTHGAEARTAPPWRFVLGPLVAGVVAVIIGRPVLKLSYFYLALATIGLGQIFLVLIHSYGPSQGGPRVGAGALAKHLRIRVQQQSPPVLLGVGRCHGHPPLRQPRPQVSGGPGLRAIATSEIASRTLGMRTANWKLLAFVASAVICGLAGGFYAFVTMAVTPGAFTFTAAIIPIVMMLIGG